MRKYIVLFVTMLAMMSCNRPVNFGIRMAKKVGHKVVDKYHAMQKIYSDVPPSFAQGTFAQEIDTNMHENILQMDEHILLRSNKDGVTLQGVAAFLADFNRIREHESLVDIDASTFGIMRPTESLPAQSIESSEAEMREMLEDVRRNANFTTEYTMHEWMDLQLLLQNSKGKETMAIVDEMTQYRTHVQFRDSLGKHKTLYPCIMLQLMPEIRCARMLVAYEVTGTTDRRILDQYAEAPRKLSVDELHYVATRLLNTRAEKTTCYELLTNIYPNDYVAWNNLAAYAIQDGEMETAEGLIDKAISLNSKAPEVVANYDIVTRCLEKK